MFFPTSTKVYSISDVIVVVGLLPITNFNQVAITPIQPKYKLYSGTRGEVTKGSSLSVLGNINLEVPQTSDDNLTLTTFESMGGVVPVLIKPVESTITMHFMPRGVISGIPEVTYAKGVSVVTWNIFGRLSIHTASGY